MDFDVDYFARLARIKLTDAEKKKFTKELGDILAHVEELKEADTTGVAPMTGGTHLRNAYREDEYDEKRVAGGKGRGNFPEEKDGFLKVPKVFHVEAGE
jgi:aspartyl-tRNA(Asn)/glutamyl-tRNA(Gln) amidotransferase subunit C